MAEIINLESKNSWNSFQDIKKNASPAIISKETERKIIEFDPEKRLREMKRGRMSLLVASELKTA